jgi:multisubunit Na+/H+ antiporter MnhB subunit
MSQYRPMRGLALAITVAVAALGLVLALAIDYLVIDLHALYSVDQGLPGTSELFWVHSRLADIRVAALLVGVVAAALWLLWQYRAHANLHWLGVDGRRFRPGSAVASWFVPAANVVLPFLAMSELWRASDPESGSIDWKKRPTGLLVPLWWMGVLGSVSLAVLGYRAAAVTRPRVHDLIGQDTYLVAACGLAIATSIVAIALVHRIEGRQFVRANRLPDELWTTWRRR